MAVDATSGNGTRTRRGRDEPDVVQAFARGLAVIRAFGANSPELTLSEVARRAGIPRAAARRLLHTLAHLGYVQSDEGRFSLRPRILELGYAYVSTLTLPEIALPHLKTLAGRVGESAYLSILDGQDNLCIAHVPVRRIWTASITVGTTLPAFATASGRVILSSYGEPELETFLGSGRYEKITPYTVTEPRRLKRELKAVRRQGWALVDQELEEGLRTVAAPVHDGEKTVAAVSVSTPARGTDTQSGRGVELVQPLLEAAAAIDADLRAASPGR